MARAVVRIVLGVGLLIVVALVVVRLMLGGGRLLEDRSTAPAIAFEAVEVVADLDYPPGNIAVSKTGRVFFTLHPDGKPPVKVVELVNNEPVPYPDAAYQRETAVIPYFQSVLALRIDSQQRLWALDFADFGTGQPRLTAFDLGTNRLVHRYDFPSDVAGLGSMLNDLQIDPTGTKVYIAETSPLLQTPALIVYDIETGTSRRLLEGDRSVAADDFIIQAPGRDIWAYGLMPLRLGVDSIALDKRGEWLYYGPVTGERLYRVRTSDLNDESLSGEALAAKVEDFAAKTLSDGLTMDVDDNIYVSDMENSAVHTIDAAGHLRTLIKGPELRWPDGFSFGSDGWLYVTCSSLHHVLFADSSSVRENAPYQIFRFKPGVAGVAGQ